MKRDDTSPQLREDAYLPEIDLDDMERASGGCANGACGCAGGAGQQANQLAQRLAGQTQR